MKKEMMMMMMMMMVSLNLVGDSQPFFSTLSSKRAGVEYSSIALSLASGLILILFHQPPIL